MEKISLKSYVASVPTPGGLGEAGNINFFLLNSFSIIFFWYSIIRCKVGLVSQPSSQKMISRLPNFWSHRHTQWRRDYNGPYLPLVFSLKFLLLQYLVIVSKKTKKKHSQKKCQKNRGKKRIQIIVRRTGRKEGTFWKSRKWKWIKKAIDELSYMFFTFCDVLKNKVNNFFCKRQANHTNSIKISSIIALQRFLLLFFFLFWF